LEKRLSCGEEVPLETCRIGASVDRDIEEQVFGFFSEFFR
jgi:hypothetical protein